VATKKKLNNQKMLTKIEMKENGKFHRLGFYTGTLSAEMG
jgi:hypothetical protein